MWARWLPSVIVARCDLCKHGLHLSNIYFSVVINSVWITLIVWFHSCKNSKALFGQNLKSSAGNERQHTSFQPWFKKNQINGKKLWKKNFINIYSEKYEFVCLGNCFALVHLSPHVILPAIVYFSRLLIFTSRLLILAWRILELLDFCLKNMKSTWRIPLPSVTITPWSHWIEGTQE